MTLDGKPLCHRTPCSKAVAAGGHLVGVALTGYVAKEERLGLLDGQTVLWTLPPDVGHISVTSTPTGLPLWLDGRPIGKTPVRRFEVAGGAHEVVVSDPCHYRVGERFQLAPAQERTFELTPTPRPAGVKVLARDDAGNDLPGVVTLDGRELGRTLRTWSVPLCSRQLSVRADGYAGRTLDLSGPACGRRRSPP